MGADDSDELRAGLAEGQVGSPILADLLTHWRSLDRGRAAPRRTAFDPMRIPALLPSVFLLGLEAESGRARIRVVGTRLSAWIGSEITGQYLDEAALPEGLRPRLLAGAASRQPFILQGRVPDRGGEVGSAYEVLGLPLADESGAPVFILGAMDFDQSRSRTRAR